MRMQVGVSGLAGLVALNAPALDPVAAPDPVAKALEVRIQAVKALLLLQLGGAALVWCWPLPLLRARTRRLHLPPALLLAQAQLQGLQQQQASLQAQAAASVQVCWLQQQLLL